ncbi:short-chain dehydrogenase [Pontibacillus yanchengensis]|uniref:Short-chain dehydrogenase n=2 Tax=Pontibacillus yanchengensis TaxID=462910 RepID=A0ACC7VAS8_9BACI|nr:short-chain dehydrogenase [Pontibacillus yanchengensis]MYL32867.1 short-chain dehydrogenase [Pontibacillus yanchengensis]MYL51777.1 short-chain dehydrogenase [Pontibacillus yanchengensis]
MNGKHALVIGGTGMLKDVSLWFADNGFVVSVIGRGKSKHEDMKESSLHPELINSLMVDYKSQLLLKDYVRSAIEKYGPISIVVSWTPFLPSIELIDHIVSEKSQSWKLYQIKGSRRYFEDGSLKLSSNCIHRNIYLGFVINNDTSRWLTNKEIANGVIKSIEEECSESIIGVLHPYEKRPGY